MIVVIVLGLIALGACLMWLGREGSTGFGVSNSVPDPEPLSQEDSMAELVEVVTRLREQQ